MTGGVTVFRSLFLLGCCCGGKSCLWCCCTGDMPVLCAVAAGIIRTADFTHGVSTELTEMNHTGGGASSDHICSADAELLCCTAGT